MTLKEYIAFSDVKSADDISSWVRVSSKPKHVRSSMIEKFATMPWTISDIIMNGRVDVYFKSPDDAIMFKLMA